MKMKLTLDGIKDKKSWEAAGVVLPSYDIEKVKEETKKSPAWVHFGIGNIFRIFIGGIADTLISNGAMDKGITCVETFDFDVVDKIYAPYDNLVLGVTLKADGSTDKKVIASLTEAIKAQSNVEAEWNRLKEIFQNKDLQMISFTITEKGYALKTEKIRFYQKGNAFLCKGSLVFWRKEDTYRKINKKNKTIYKEKENNGNNGNNSRNTGGA